MFKVITRNSVYTIRPVSTGFEVFKSADMWGRKVNDNHKHYTTSLSVKLGGPLVTGALRTSDVKAIIGA